MLRAWPLYRDLSLDNQALVNATARTKCLLANTPILHKGDCIDGAYIVLTGCLRVFTMAPNGSQATLYFVEPGETCVLALNCLFHDLRYPAWVEAESDTQIAIIPHAIYRTLHRTETIVQDLTLRSMSQAAFRLVESIEHMHGLSLEQRLANFIVARMNPDGLLRMTQQHMAQHLGTSREVIARLLSRFVSLGWLKTQRGAVKVESVAHLLQLSAATDSLQFLQETLPAFKAEQAVPLRW